MTTKIANNAVSKLAAPIGAVDVSLTVLAGDGNAKFPSLSAGDTFPSTLIDSAGNIEIITVTARSADVFTITRGQESTVARAFNAGDRIELRLTAAVITDMQNTASTALANANSAITTNNTQDAEIAALQAAMPTGFGPVPWSRPSLPTGWIWADGSVLLGTTPYTALRNAYIADGFPFGQDGSGNPKVPDMRGRVGAGQDNMGGTAANRLTLGGSGIAGTTLGASGGAETHTLSTAQMPAHSHGVTDPGHGHTNSGISLLNGSNLAAGSGYVWTGASNGSSTTGVSIQNQGGGGAHNNAQPTLVVGYIIKT